jgi:hypothetical protein
MLPSSYRIRSVLFSAVRTSVLAGVTCALTACLVTDTIDYDKPNTPAQVKKLGFQGVRSVPNFRDCTDASNGWLNFSVSVRDPDVEDELVARVIINGELVKSGRVGGVGVQRDDFDYCALLDDLSKPCVHVEILVSSDFSDPGGLEDARGTSDPLDLGYVDWWLVGPTKDYPEVGVTECQNLIPDER